MKTKLYAFLYFGCLMMMGACKKEVSNGKDQKTKMYENYGYHYLFTVDNVLYDSIRPLYFGKTSNGEVKFIIREYKIGNKVNTAFVYNGKIVPWNLPGFNMTNLQWPDCFSLDMNNQLQYETFYRSSKYLYYLEKNGTKASNKWTTEIGDSFNMKNASYNWSWKPKELNSMQYYFNSNSIEKPYIYKGGLFEYYGASFLLYNLPRDIHEQTYGSVLHIIKRNATSVEYADSFYSEKLVADMDGGTEVYQEGLNIELIETGTPNPMFMFWSDWNSFSQKNVVFMPAFNSTKLISINFPYPVYNNLKFFYNKGNIYANTKHQLFKVNQLNAISESVDLKLLQVRGVFGNSNGIIVVVENDEGGLDVLELNG